VAFWGVVVLGVFGCLTRGSEIEKLKTTIGKRREKCAQRWGKWGRLFIDEGNALC
jgi:hypothetical protein